MVREDVPAGHAFTVEGEHTRPLLRLLSGLAAVTQEGRGARAVIRPGETFGEVAPLMRMARTATVTAMTPCVAASCDRATFDELLRPLYVADMTPDLEYDPASDRTGQAALAQSPKRLVVTAAHARPRSGSTQRKVPAPPKWPNVRDEVRPPDQCARLRALELDAKPPVERAEPPVVGEHAVEARELDRHHLVARLRGDERRREELAAERQDVVERTVHPGARVPLGSSPRWSGRPTASRT